MTEATHKPLQCLQSGATVVEVNPQLGGSIARFYTRLNGRHVDLLRPAPPTPADENAVLQSACFPLIPYSGRIANARFDFDDLQVREPVLGLFRPNSIHGHGWLRHWQVSETTRSPSTSHLRIDYTHDPDGWPWAYRATQSFTLTEHMLSITAAITNQSESLMPAGLGLHPYFPLHHDARIKTITTGMWQSDDAVLPTQHVALDADGPFNREIVVRQQPLDNAFTGWSRKAEILWPQLGLSLEMTADTDFLIIFTPPGENFFCVEPASHPPDSLRSLTQRKDRPDPDDHARLGRFEDQTIEAGQTMQITMHLKIRPEVAPT